MSDKVNKCMKILLIVGNLLFMVCGALLLGIGIWVTQDNTTLLRFLGLINLPSPSIVAYILIAIGVVILLIAFIGFAGACCENKCLLLAFFIIELLIAVLLVVGIALAVIFKSEMYGTAKNKMTTSLTKDYDPKKKEYDMWNKIQMTFKCCAVRTGEFFIYSSTPWGRALNANPDKKEEDIPKFPKSCCINPKTCDNTKSADPQVNPELNREGCWNTISEMADKYSKPAIAALVVTIIILIISMVFAMVIFCQLRRLDGQYV